jgi:Tfp pilus assembly protein PilF
MEKVLFVLILGISFHGSIAQDLLSQRKTERCFTSARELFERNELGAARESFEEFLKISPGQDGRRVQAEYYQALCALSLHHIDGERLMVSFCEAHANDPHASVGRYDLGNFFYTDKNYIRAAKEYGNADFHALTAEQQNNGRFRWGYSLFNQKKLPESLDQFNVVKTQGGQYGPAASYYSGFIEYSVGEFDNALVDLKRADQGPSYAKIVPYLLANVYYKQKNFDGLLTYVSSLKDMDDISNSDEIALLSAEAYFKKSDYKNALSGYQRYFKGKENADQGVLSRAGYAAYSIVLFGSSLFETAREALGPHGIQQCAKVQIKPSCRGRESVPTRKN